MDQFNRQNEAVLQNHLKGNLAQLQLVSFFRPMPGAIEGDSVQLSGGTRLRVARRRRDVARAVSDLL